MNYVPTKIRSLMNVDSSNTQKLFVNKSITKKNMKKVSTRPCKTGRLVDSPVREILGEMYLLALCKLVN